MSSDRIECPPVPECEKLRCYREEIGSIRRFLEFLDEQRLFIAAVDDDGDYYLALDSREQLIYRHFGIDGQALERERRALLDYQRVLTARSTRA
jgi:hypothetical protein